VSQIIIDLIRFVIGLIEKACSGDIDALQQLVDFVPDNMRTELVAKVQDEVDLKKFGPRSKS
jgi:hypothetical protein